MIDLTPLDVRNKRGDFRKALRGYDPEEVDVFLELVADRLEAVVRDNIQMRERTEQLQEQVNSSTGRERAVQEALVTAQELREDIRGQAQREAELIIQEAQAQARQRIAEGERKLEALNDAMVEVERRRLRFLKGFRQFLERELDGIDVQEGSGPAEDVRAPVEVVREPVEDVREPVEERAVKLHLSGPSDADVPVASEARPERDLFSLPDVRLPGDDDEPERP